LRASTELTLYENIDDAISHRPRKCINGTIEATSSGSAILYDKKLVRIKGIIKDYYLPNDDIEAIHVTIKNNCYSSKFFIATEITTVTSGMDLSKN
jgi:hypothetical protein